MTTYLADSDVLIDFFNKRNPERDTLERLMRNERVVISVITLLEVRRGWNPDQAKKLRRIKKIEKLSISGEWADLSSFVR
jgi:predicted nucleic acid-binding protein